MREVTEVILKRLIESKRKARIYGYNAKNQFSSIYRWLFYNLIAIDKWILNVFMGPVWNILFKPKIKFGYHGDTMSGIMGMNLLIGCEGRFRSFYYLCRLLSKIDKGHCGDAAKYELLHDTTGEPTGFAIREDRIVQIPKEIKRDDV